MDFLEIIIDAVIACCLWWDAISRLITVEAMIRGYHEYKIIWLNPVIEEELSCKREIGNAHDTHAVAVCNIIDGDVKLLDMFHANPLHYVWFLTDEVHGSIQCIVKGNRRYSSDLPQDRWTSIFSVENIYYLCSNQTNQSKRTSHYRAHYCMCN